MTPPAPSDARVRRTPLAARGEPMVWVMGAGLLTCLVLIIGLLGLVVVQGASTFWPRPIDQVTLRNGEVFLGIPVQEEFFDPSRQVAAEVEALREAGELPEGVQRRDGSIARRMYRAGNRELGQQPSRWVSLHEIESIERPRRATILERREWGIWLGTPQAVIIQHEAAPGEEPQREVLAEGPEAAWEAFRRLHPDALARRKEIESLMRHDIGRVNREMDRWRLRVREAELSLHDAQQRDREPLGYPAWLGLLALTGLCIAGATTVSRRAARAGIGGVARAKTNIAVTALWGLAVVGGMALALERPWQIHATPEHVQEVREQADAAMIELQARYDEILSTSRELAARDARYRVIFTEPRTGRFAPMRQTEPDEPLVMSQIVRAVAPNDLSLGGRIAVYLDRWREFLTADPREANTEGGVFPVIFGTVVLTILLSIAVVPLGVIAALYLREYAKQGLVTSTLRIAVNNLAGVPSIVYGMFGVIFFRYTLGAYIDTGPDQPAEVFPWWLTVGGLLIIVVGAVALASFARPRPGTPAERWQIWFARTAATLWIAAVVMVVLLLFTTPYFTGFFRAQQPSPTFASPGLLWGALTLALLTLPVVIVATEEAIAAVPRTMREGSYGAGASKWQTIRYIVLPGAMPGIMTGMILAMARGAGEVAPLMLVGAVKLAPELPISTQPPFLHADRSFMHLGFHIYDLGFQSPDADAARPLVWTTTLLLITIVVLLNLVAIAIRARLRARLRSQQF